MGVKKSDLIKLCKTIMEDCPLPTVEQVLMAATDSDVNTKEMLAFIQQNYSEEEKQVGLQQFIENITLFQKLYGGK